MMRNRLLGICLLLLASLSPVAEGLELSGCYGDHMVLQRNKPIVIAGRSAPGSGVVVKLAGAQSQATGDAEGRWKVVLPPMAAAGPLTLSIQESNGESRCFKDVWIGEVWLASGQSNMAFALIDAENGAADVAAACKPMIRLFQVPERMERTPVDSMTGSWQVCTPESARVFSAIGYHFACRLQQELGVALGIINASRGATGIESWMDVSSLQSVTGKDYTGIAAGKGPLTGEPVETVLYNGMIHPWTSYPIRGILWYQGEANAYRSHEEYGRLSASMLKSWRSVWNDPELVFLFVQLAAFRGHDPAKRFSEKELNEPDPDDSGLWGAFRSVQAELLRFPYTGMATAIDLGDPYDIHPRRKKELADRLALEAERVIYGRTTLVTHGPYPLKGERAGEGALRISFDNPGSLLTSGDGRDLRHFALAGADGIFHPARAEICAPNQLRVWSPQVPQPVTVRYAWSDYPGKINFYNTHGFPAVPFQLDIR